VLVPLDGFSLLLQLLHVFTEVLEVPMTVSRWRPRQEGTN
jgi:hypothetical protein